LQDTYKTIAQPSEFSLFKDKGSKFYGYAFPITSENEISPIIEFLKKEHHKARHWCYAWQLGDDYSQYRINDDGEPSGSAGLPIYGQIQSKDLTNILVVVVRYFGGTKLGVSGLISAYKKTAQLALEQSDFITKTIDNQYLLTFSYIDLNKILRILKNSSAKILTQNMEMECKYNISIRKTENNSFIKALEETRCVIWTRLN
jgi:uncharacterized YigZ family protein